MKNQLLFCITTLLFGACSGVNNKDTVSDSIFEKLNVVAAKVTTSDNSYLSCDITQLKDTIDLPLSALTEDLQIVKLDKRDEALIGNSYISVSENYILVRNERQNPYKLFDKKGNYITSVGSYGQGPGEYLNVYADYLDEVNNRIYILPWQSKQLLVYNLKGEVQPPIPLTYRVPKGHFHINTKDSTVSVGILPFEGSSAVVWTQDFKGNQIHSIAPSYLTVMPDFSNEVMSNGNTNEFDFSIFTFFELRSDTLYHYQPEAKKLLPQFTLDFKDKPITIHGYQELPLHFLGDITIEKKISETTSVTEYPAKFIVDKRTLKGAFYRLYNDFMGNAPIQWASFVRGYYVASMDPGDLTDILTKQLNSGIDLSENQREKLKKLLNSIDPNDNNYVLYAKLKTN